MDLRLMLMAFAAAAPAFWAAFVLRRLPAVLLLLFAVVVFASLFPPYMEWLCLSQQATPEQAVQVRHDAARWGWVFGLAWALGVFGAAKLGRRFARSHRRRLGLPF